MVLGFGKKKELEVYSLKNDDILYFLHIPKAGGTTLIEMLDKYFEPETVLNLHEWPEVLTNMPIEFSKYRFIRGHFGYSVLRLLPKKPICITMLREPVELMISSYKMVQRQPKESKLYSVKKDQSVSDLITDPNRYSPTNRLAHHIVAELDVLSMIKGMTKDEIENFYPHHQKGFFLEEMPEKELLEKAKKRITEDFLFFGLVEKMEESLFLLHYQFGWKPIRGFPAKNVSPEEQKTGLSEEAKDKLLELTNVDRKLYEYGKELFDSRYSKMIDDLKENHFQPSFENLSQNDLVYEMLKKHYDSRNEINLNQ